MGTKQQRSPRATSPRRVEVPEAYDPGCFDELKFADKFQVLMQARNAFSNPEFIDALEARLADLLEISASSAGNKLLVPEVKVRMEPGQVPL